MTYADQWTLSFDTGFGTRCRAALVQQAMTYKDDGNPTIAALGNAVLKGSEAHIGAFLPMLAAAPGFAGKIDTGSGVDTSLVTDGDILAAVQSDWPVVAGLFFDGTGAPK